MEQKNNDLEYGFQLDVMPSPPPHHHLTITTITTTTATTTTTVTTVVIIITTTTITHLSSQPGFLAQYRGGHINPELLARERQKRLAGDLRNIL
jgi:hypothetical protein